MEMSTATCCRICKTTFTLENGAGPLEADVCPQCQGYYIAEINKSSADTKSRQDFIITPLHLPSSKAVTLGLSTGTSINVPDIQLSPMSIYNDIKSTVNALGQRVDTVEKAKIKRFEQEDVYEVHKRIERLERKNAELEINLLALKKKASKEKIVLFGIVVTLGPLGTFLMGLMTGA